MKPFAACILVILLAFALIAAFDAGPQEHLELRPLAPEGYSYADAARCADCKGPDNSFMPRAAGVDITGEKPVPDERGWLASRHSRSQSHGDRIDTSCAWCHAPLTPGAVRDEDKAEPIALGNRNGVTCSACHPGTLERSLRESLLINFHPGSDPAKKASYIFRSRTDGRDFNAQCRFCHHQSHDLLLERKHEMQEAGELRCVDCHMAAYSKQGLRVERFHNFKVKANLPHSCSGSVGRSMNCHEGRTVDWFTDNLNRVKGPRKTWEAE
jgi:hypothetical protein